MKVLIPEEAADFLRISTYTLLEQARKGLVPAAKIGGAWRFLAEELELHLRKMLAGKPEPVEIIKPARRQPRTPPKLTGARN